MIRRGSARLVASTLGFTLIGCGMASVKSLGELDEVAVEFGAAGVREVRSAFRDVSSLPAPVVEWLAENGSISLVVEEKTPERVVLRAQAQREERGAADVRILAEPDREDVSMRLLRSGAVVVTIRSASGDALETATPLIQAVLPERTVRVEIPDDAQAGATFDSSQRLRESGARKIVVASPSAR